MHLKIVTTLFEKMKWFIEFIATIHEILAIKRDADSAEI